MKLWSEEYKRRETRYWLRRLQTFLVFLTWFRYNEDGLLLAPLHDVSLHDWDDQRMPYIE